MLVGEQKFAEHSRYKRECNQGTAKTGCMRAGESRRAHLEWKQCLDLVSSSCRRRAGRGRRLVASDGDSRSSTSGNSTGSTHTALAPLHWLHCCRIGNSTGSEGWGVGGKAVRTFTHSWPSSQWAQHPRTAIQPQVRKHMSFTV